MCMNNRGKSLFMGTAKFYMNNKGDSLFMGTDN